MYTITLMDYFFRRKFKLRLEKPKKALPLMWWTVLAFFIFEAL